MAESAYAKARESGLTYSEYSKRQIDRLSAESRRGTLTGSERGELNQLLSD